MPNQEGPLHAAITINRPRTEVERLWASPEHRLEHVEKSGGTVRFAEAPGDHGTEIHVDFEPNGPARIGAGVKKLIGAAPLAKVKDDLRRFKQLVETGEVARSDATPEGESAGRKLRQRPAQPLAQPELEKAGV
jgi:hypothetical protein